jgi:hypothetical protein
MRWINLIGIVPLAMIMSALLARLSRPAEDRYPPSNRQAGRP